MRNQIAISLIAFLAATSANAQVSPLANASREAVRFTQPLAPGSSVALGETSALVASRSYHERVSAADLERGVDILAQGAGAVVRLTPVKGTGAAQAKGAGRLRVADLEISRGGANPVGLERSGALVADADELKASQPELFAETLAFKVPDAMGKGRFRLKAAGKIAAGEDYMIQVFDKSSDVELGVDTARQHHFAGGAVLARARMSNGADMGKAAVSAALMGPLGQRYDLKVRANGAAIDIDGVIPAGARMAPGELWRIAVRYREKAGAAPVYRDAELALAVGKQSARITGAAARNGGVDVAVSVAEAGRYEARAIVFARSSASGWAPAGVVYSAAWLDAGARTLSLDPDLAALHAAGYGPPYRVRQLQLLDQSRLMVLETQVSDALPQIGQ
jgi:hypothetical protein